MAIAKAALSQLFAWCPLNQQSRPEAVIQRQDSGPSDDATVSIRPAKPHRRISETVLPVASPDMRQCEPWRQPALLDAATRNDPTRHEHLTR
jgi:hypothetical protein